MKTAMARSPTASVEALLMFSAPRLGPMVRSSMISIGARQRAGAQQQGGVGGFFGWSHAARRSARAAADLAADHRRGDDLALPFSISRMAIRLPTFSRVMSLKMRAPAASSVRCTGRLVVLAGRSPAGRR